MPVLPDHPISSRRRYDRFGTSPGGANDSTIVRTVFHTRVLDMRFLISLVLVGLLGACGERAPLPFPDPAAGTEPLVVLVAPGPLTYVANPSGLANPSSAADAEDPEEMVSGLEYDLLQSFAKELGVPVRFIMTSPQQIRKRLMAHEAHLAMGWLTPDGGENQGVIYGAPCLESRSVLVRHESAPPIPKLERLGAQTVVALEGSQQHRILQELRNSQSGLVVESFPAGTSLDLLEAVAARKVDTALVDQAMLDLGLNFYPMLKPGLKVGASYPITWMFPADGDPEVLRRARLFVDKVRDSMEMSRLHDRYLGHVKRLDANDVGVFLTRIKTLLPHYRAIFEEAGRRNDLDWRLLAALSYQESHWNPLNTSPTGVRGMMMLTTETADRLGVKNRLDPQESILGGARYVNFLRNNLPESVPEPDRTWQALAAYNIGPGHFNAARTIARQLQVNGDSWFEMKKVLPLLARPHYYTRLKSGRGRGGEAVILAENVRMYYDILQHHAPYSTLEEIEDQGPGLRPPSPTPGQGISIGLKAREEKGDMPAS